MWPIVKMEGADYRCTVAVRRTCKAYGTRGCGTTAQRRAHEHRLPLFVPLGCCLMVVSSMSSRHCRRSLQFSYCYILITADTFVLELCKERVVFCYINVRENLGTAVCGAPCIASFEPKHRGVLCTIMSTYALGRQPGISYSFLPPTQPPAAADNSSVANVIFCCS